MAGVSSRQYDGMVCPKKKKIYIYIWTRFGMRCSSNNPADEVIKVNRVNVLLFTGWTLIEGVSGWGGILNNITGKINNQATSTREKKIQRGIMIAQIHFLNRHKWSVRIYVSSPAEKKTTVRMSFKEEKPNHFTSLICSFLPQFHREDFLCVANRIARWAVDISPGFHNETKISKITAN